MFTSVDIHIPKEDADKSNATDRIFTDHPVRPHLTTLLPVDNERIFT